MITITPYSELPTTLFLLPIVPIILKTGERMYKLNFGKLLTDEEQFLLKKYKTLRERKEKLLKTCQVHEKPPQIPMSSKFAMGNISTATTINLKKENLVEAKEKAKMLLMSGKISIPRPEKTGGFKRASVLARKKVSEGQPSKVPKLSAPPSELVQHSGARRSVGEGAPILERFEGSRQPPLAPPPQRLHKYGQQLASAHYGTSSSQESSRASSAAWDWKRTIEKDRHHKNRNQGEYFDYKRRIIKYDKSSDSSDDN